MERKAAYLCLFIFVYITVASSPTEATKLNYPRVLLPIFDKISINFTLEVIEKGCFKWISSRQDLILITPLYESADEECSYRATVTVLSRERRRNTAIVLAEDLATGESLRCDVILDVIDKLTVLSTTRQLYLEEAPETFELRAADSQGNAFTTLEGVEFNWMISSLNPQNKAWAPALRFLTFSESLYHVVPPELEKFEAQNIKGFMVLLEGVNTGTAKVTVSMPYDEYSHVPTIEVYINILANIILEPSDVHILTGDTVNFRILQMKAGKLQEIALNDQYYLEIEDNTVATIKGSKATGLALGRTSVVLRDRNVPNDGVAVDNAITKSSIPSAQLTVAEPVKLGVSLLPHNNWVTVEGERHEIAFDLYTRNDQKITLGSRYAMKSEFDELLFYVLRKSKNGSRLFGEALKEGISPVYGEFKGLTAQAELQIFSELKLTPNKVILPYDPNIVKTQKIQFQAHGGDGTYVWQTQNTHLLHINQNGLATTVIRDSDLKRGQDSFETSGAVLTSHTAVRVALAKNTKIQRQAEIYFLPPVKLEIIKYNFETALKDYVRLHIAVYAQVDNKLVPFTKCDNLLFDLELSNQIFQVDNNVETPVDMAHGACHVLHLRSTAVGLSHLRVTYKFQEKALKDEVTLNVFEPLSVMNPLENEIVLPIGSSRNVIYSNGPQRIFTLEAELTKSTAYDQKVAEVSEIEFDSQKFMYAFTVLCRKIGETAFTYNVHNVLAAPNYQPYISTVTTKVHCVKPRFLNLYATEELRSSCPMEQKRSLLHLKERDDKFEVEIEVQDSKNRKLMNISSLFIEWEFAAGDKRYHNDVIMHHRSSEIEYVEGVRLPGKDVLITTVGTDIAPNFRIKGVVTRYDSVLLGKHNIRADEPPFGIKNAKTGEVFTPLIENEIRFMAVNTTIFSSDHISIFMAKNRRERLPIQQGSGFFEFLLSEPGVVNVEYDDKEKEMIITPLRIGHSRLELMDRCLMSEPVYLSISVVAIGAIRVEVPDRVERTKTIEAIVRLYDSNDNILHVDPFNLHIYELSEDIFNANILSIQLGEQSDLNVGEIRYVVTGNKLGETKIVFNSGTGDTMVSSEPANVQVFPPLRLFPRNSTLVIGSSVQIYYHGGPQPDVNIVYHVHDKKVISMESAIVTAHKLGATKITGKCMMVNPGNGKSVVISEDSVEVHVVPLLNIQIKTPLTRIRSGAVMPAAVWGVPDLSPMVLGTLENMRVTWSTNQPDVVDIYNIFADAGIEYSSTDLISVRIKALNPGKAKIHATVELPAGQKISTTVELVVFKILELESPKHITMDWILVAPRSTIQLKANLDDVIYKPDADSNGIVRVSNDGVVRTQDTLGRDLIIAKTFEQTLPIGIEVKNVQYLLASLDYPPIKLKKTEEKIPRGMNFVLKVSLHDNLGNEFAHNIEEANGIKYDLSHKDVVDVQIGNNMTIAINLPRETNNMIAVSLKDSTGVKHAEDYIKLSVAESKHIYPTKTIFSVGDIICFDTPLTLSSIWRSSDEQIVSIDKFTGIAKVLNNRFKLGEKIVVTNGDKGTGAGGGGGGVGGLIGSGSGSFIKYDVEVRDADVIQLLKSYDIFSGSSYRAHLVVRNHLQMDKFTNLFATNISKCSSQLDEKMPVKLFTCQLKSKQSLGQQILEHYKTTAMFEIETGRYACQIDLKSNFNDVLNIVKTNDVQLELQAQLPNGLTDSLTLKFVPGVRVTPESMMAADLKDHDLMVTGLDKVLQKIEVKPSDPKLLQVTPQSKGHGALQYRVKMLVELPADETVFVNVHSPSTLQDIKIPILSSAQLQKCSTLPFNNSSAFVIKIVSNIGLIITGLVLLGTSIWVYVTCSPGRNKTAINADVFSTSLKSNANASRTSVTGSTPPGSAPNTPLYPNLSPYYGNQSANFSSGNEAQVYGDSTLVSPQRRINRRYL